MKKADIFVIALVLLLSIGFYVIYFSNNLLSSEDSGYEVEVYYKRDLVYSVELEQDTNVRVSLETKNNNLYIKIDLNGDGNYDIIQDAIAIGNNSEILNIVHIKYGDIHMEEANCKNKLCMNMRIGLTLSTPIFCTNDVLIKLVTSEYRIIV